MKVSVAVPTYNEESNVGYLLDTLRRQETFLAQIVEIVVVASGCTDRTIEVVKEHQRKPGIPIRLIVEPVRCGKVAAINTYFRHGNAKVDAICVCSADVLVAPNAIELLVAPLHRHPDVGMSGARPIPTNGKGTFLGEATRFLWNMHHRVALEAPKLGEMVMVRAGIVHDLPAESAVDEASLEQLVSADGYRLVYVPDAIVHNHGPETLREFVRQRRRIAAGHYWLRHVSGYAVATMDLSRIVRLTLSELSVRSPRLLLYSLGTIGLEAASRALGYYDFRTHNRHVVWKVSETTKAVMTDEIQPLYQTEEREAEDGVTPRRAAGTQARK
ncbi:MAG TPA: glycosyltransferase [Haliangiales bacterium]|nr:glycosyltransferase [Haliangiales bacterium]